MEKELLVRELSTKVKRYKAKAKNIIFDMNSVGDTIFIQQKNETFLNPKYISVANYFEIFALESFLKEHNDLNAEQVEDIINGKYLDFEFLRKLNCSIPNMIDQIKTHGAKSAAIIYVNGILYPQQESNLQQ